MMRTARAPSAKVGSPSTLALSPALMARQGVGDEGVEAVLVALRVAGRDGGVRRRGWVELVRVALDDLRRAAPPDPQVSGCSWSKASVAPSVTTSSRSWFLWPAEIWLTTTEPLVPADGAKQHERHVFGGDVPPGPNALTPTGREGVSGHRVLRSVAPYQLRAHRREAIAGHELHEIAPVRADVGEGTRWTRQLGIDAPVVVLLRRQPVLQVAPVSEAHGGAPLATRAHASRTIG